MTNSGSSANLLVLSALTNPLNKKRIREIRGNYTCNLLVYIIMANFTKNNLKPVFVDVDINTFNISLLDLKKK